ncbi:CASTOR/POLLUX-related putative ion channel [Microbacterium sp. GXF7504]
MRARLQYRFDNWMSRGTFAIMALLGAATVAFVLLIATVVMVFRAFPEGVEEGDFWDVAWGNLMRTLDPGTMGADAGWGYRLLMLVVTVGGLVIVASLIGIVSGAFDDKIASLRKGRSRVLEEGHTVILGWSGKLLPVLAEICVANRSRRRSVIVVLADRDKLEMEEAIRAHVPRPGRTTIICRKGDPMSILDLRMASPGTARSAVILPADDEPDPDAVVIKVALALSREAETAGTGVPRIVAELRDPANLPAANLVASGRAQWLLAADLISRMTVQTCRQGGLSAVYTELLDFAGDEIYFTEEPRLAGLTFHDAQFRFASCTLLGLSRRDEVRLNPPADTVLRAGDRLIVLAEDDSTVALADEPARPDLDAVRAVPAGPPQPEHTLILGCNAGLQTMIDELATYVAPGSTVCVAADVPHHGLRVPEGLDLTFHSADTTDRGVLDGLDIVRFDHVLVLAYRELGAQAADAKTLVTLLHLRDIADTQAVELNIVSEMLDDRNRELAEVTRAEDFIVSDRLVSLMLSQISESEGLVSVFAELFSSSGVEIYLRPAALYVDPEVEVGFATVVEAASRRGETAIGFRAAADVRSGGASSGVRLNPPAGLVRRYGPGDAVIVLAEDAGRTAGSPADAAVARRTAPVS